jgi:hypothetical protein
MSDNNLRSFPEIDMHTTQICIIIDVELQKEC